MAYSILSIAETRDSALSFGIVWVLVWVYMYEQSIAIGILKSILDFGFRRSQRQCSEF